VNTELKHYTVRDIVEDFTYDGPEGKGAGMAKGMGVSLGRPRVDGGECAARALRTY